MSDLAHITSDELIIELSSRMQSMAIICCYDNEDGGRYKSNLKGPFHEVAGLLTLLALQHNYKIQAFYQDGWDAGQRNQEGEEWKND